MNETSKFEHWCVVELSDHQQIAGRVTAEAIGSATFIRVFVPATSTQPTFARFFSPAAIYAITPVEQKVAIQTAEWLGISPLGDADEPDAQDDSAAPTKHIIHRVERYVSKSGNDTWKAHDSAGTIIYLRQAHRKMLLAAGLWDQLNAMPVGFGWEADITLHTVPDGDFLKPVRFEPDGWVREPAGQQDGRAKVKGEAADWARQLLASGNFVIFDTETAGFDDHDEIIQIGVIDQDGNTVLDQLIKPGQSILNSQYHGITDELVKDAPAFPAVYEQIRAALEGKKVLAYNWEYDAQRLARDCQRHALEPLLGVPDVSGNCVMEWYAQFNGEWNDYHGNYRWKKLREALAAFGLKHEDFGTKEHDAATDARATLAVIRKMAEWQAESTN